MWATTQGSMVMGALSKCCKLTDVGCQSGVSAGKPRAEAPPGQLGGGQTMLPTSMVVRDVWSQEPLA